jgi:aerobic-type carbon monoxide dehydrogenase small subunit (CoxS/CutS family)
MMLAVEAVGMEITTIEGLSASGALHPVQQAFIDHDATQCGFCTPGMIMTTVHFLQKHPQPSLDEVKVALRGNLCRCGTHPNVFKAVLEASKKI